MVLEIMAAAATVVVARAEAARVEVDSVVVVKGEEGMAAAGSVAVEWVVAEMGAALTGVAAMAAEKVAEVVTDEECMAVADSEGVAKVVVAKAVVVKVEAVRVEVD